MEIYKLYEVVRIWEIALSLIKPICVTKVTVSPIIEDDILGMGEGKIYSYLKIHVEAEGKYTDLIWGWDTTPYKDREEKKWVVESQIFLLTEYIEDRMDNDYINSFWEDYPWDVEWKPLP